jgi:hypothetical protein
MSRTIIFIFFSSLVILSCNDDKAQEKALLAEVIKTHDKLMADDGAIMKNKMAMKYYANITPDVQDSVARYNQLLGNADDAMMNWMNKFNPDFTGKSHEQIMTYLNGQKAQIIKLDSQINSAIAASNKYLTKIKAK